MFDFDVVTDTPSRLRAPKPQAAPRQEEPRRSAVPLDEGDRNERSRQPTGERPV
jgi:hypothetical protein